MEWNVSLALGWVGAVTDEDTEISAGSDQDGEEGGWDGLFMC